MNATRAAPDMDRTALMTTDSKAAPFPLGQANKGFRGTIVAVGGREPSQTPMQDDFNEELERRLLEIGFVEGAIVEVLHEGLIGGDPIALRVDDMNVALRRREANAILVTADITPFHIKA